MISILCPTKYRPEGLRRMWESALETSSLKLELVLYVEEYDLETLHDIPLLPNNDSINTIIGDGQQIYSNLHNVCCDASKYDIVMGAADDIVFRTKGWDKRVVEEFDKLNKDQIAYVYPNDGHHGENLGTHGFFHRNWFNTLGYLSPPIFSVDYSDNYVMDLSRSLGRAIYMPDVLVEHMHWSFGKSDFDVTAQVAHEKRLRDNNKEKYESSKIIVDSDAEKLRSIMEK